MSLSVIIVNFNTKDLLKKCLESIPSSIQYSVFSIQIIVVDNGSTDGSVDMIKGTIIHNTKFKIRLIENQTNLGFAKAVNLAIRQGQDGPVLLLNSDTFVKKGAIEKLLKFEEQVRPAIIGARMLNPDGTFQGSCFYLPTIDRAVKEYWFGKSGYFSKYAPTGDKPVEVEAVSGGAMLISRGVIDKIGLLDERYFFYFEDLDYCRRAQKAGFKIYFLPSAQIIHEHGASGKNLANESNQWRRMIPSSKIYYGLFKYYLITLIIWLGQKLSVKIK